VHKKINNTWASCILFLISCVFSFLLLEIGYRLYLHQKISHSLGKEIQIDPNEKISYYTYPAPWIYDREQGFYFNNSNYWSGGSIVNQSVESYSQGNIGNKYGNYGEVIGDYEKADLKIMLLGSSHTMGNFDKGNVSNILQELLSKRLKKTVHVLNYSRDSTGVLTMVDIAKDKIDEMNPDLLIFTFNTSGLIYQRYWRFVSQDPENPDFYRFYQSMDPEMISDPRRTKFYYNFVITPLVTEAWGKLISKALATGDKEFLKNDPLVKKMVTEYLENCRMLNKNRFTTLPFHTLKASLVMNRLLRGNPFYNLQKYDEQVVGAPISFNNYNQDEKFISALNYIKTKHIPFVFIHLPSGLEFEEGKDYAFKKWHVPLTQGESLVESLKTITSNRLVELNHYYPLDKIKEPYQLSCSKEDCHPNKEGIEVMAHALENCLMEKIYTKNARN
jgi:hypothetical protein